MEKTDRIEVGILDTNNAPILLIKLADKLVDNGSRNEIRLFDKNGKETCWLVRRK